MLALLDLRCHWSRPDPNTSAPAGTCRAASPAQTGDSFWVAMEITENRAPHGSAMVAIRPNGESFGSTSAVPPAATNAATVALVSATAR